jgi:hypothetical protein
VRALGCAHRRRSGTPAERTAGAGVAAWAPPVVPEFIARHLQWICISTVLESAREQNAARITGRQGNAAGPVRPAHPQPARPRPAGSRGPEARWSSRDTAPETRRRKKKCPVMSHNSCAQQALSYRYAVYGRIALKKRVNWFPYRFLLYNF